jgi:hypothetical protein
MWLNYISGYNRSTANAARSGTNRSLITTINTIAMTALSLTPQQPSSSPFDTIRHYDENGMEFWKARELQKILGYVKWERFDDAIDRAKASLAITEGSLNTSHINHFPGSVSAKGRFGDDYQLSRKACYTIAMNGIVYGKHQQTLIGA